MLCLSSLLPLFHRHLHPVLSPQRELVQSQRWGVRESHIFWQTGLCSDVVFPVGSFSLPLLFLSPSGSCLLHKKVQLLSEPLVTRCPPSRLSVAEETHSDSGIRAKRTAHWTRLCRSIGMGRLLSCQVLIILNNYRE